MNNNNKLDELQELFNEIKNLKDSINKLGERIVALEKKLNKYIIEKEKIPQPVTPESIKPPTEPTIQPPSSHPTPPTHPPSAPPPPPPPPLPTPPKPPPPITTTPIQTIPPQKSSGIGEAEIGLKWFSRGGIILLVVGLAFFIKYAIDNQWLGPIMRLVIGILAGLALLISGEIFHKKEKYSGYAQVLIGGGFATLYFTIYAAYHFYGNITGISQSFDIFLLTIIILCEIVFSLKYDSIVIASEAYFLGYLTAYLTGALTIHSLIYSLILAIGLLILVYIKGWVAIAAGGLAATYLIHANWLRYNSSQHLTNLFFLLIYFVIFIALSFISKGKVKLLKPQEEISNVGKHIIYIIFIVSFGLPLLVINITNVYLLYYLILLVAMSFITLRHQLTYLGIFCISANYLIYVVWHRQNPQETDWAALFLVIYFLLFIIYTFLYSIIFSEKSIIENVITVLINVFSFFGFLFYKYKIMMGYETAYPGLLTIGMAGFCLFLSYISTLRKIKHLFTTYLVLCIIFVTLAVPIQLSKEWFAISWAIEALALLCLSFKFKNYALRVLSQIVGLIATISTVFYAIQLKEIRIITFLLTIVTFYISAELYYKYKEDLEDYELTPALPNIYIFLATFLLTLLFGLEINKSFVPIPWAIEMIALLTIGILIDNIAFRITSQLVGILTVGWTLFYITAIADTRIIVYFITIVIFYSSAILFNNLREKITSEIEHEKYLPGIYATIATVLLTVLLALELRGAWISVAWGMEGILILIAGIFMRKKTIRFFGMGLFALTLLKVIAYDMSSLDIIFRVISLIGFGLILLLASFIYYKYRERIEDILE